MFNLSAQRLVSGVVVGLVAGLFPNMAAVAQGQNIATQEVQIKFKGVVGNQGFECGKSYDLGTPALSMMPTDFRFYVFDVQLIDETGKTVTLTLQQDGKWQYKNVALLDFENKTGSCTNGTVETREMVVGNVPVGKYQGVQFKMGVPFNLNHNDAALAASPLNLTSLWWNWRGGYKFLRIDLSRGDSHAKQNSPHHEDKNTGFMIHIGSTGCQANMDNQKPAQCLNPNISEVKLSNFDVSQNVIVADLKALVEDSNLGMNQPDTPLGCMSTPTDGDCQKIMLNLGLPFSNNQSSSQKFFRIE